MGDGTEPPPKLDRETLQRAEVAQCAIRRDLDNLTRGIREGTGHHKRGTGHERCLPK